MVGDFKVLFGLRKIKRTLDEKWKAFKFLLKQGQIPDFDKIGGKDLDFYIDLTASQLAYIDIVLLVEYTEHRAAFREMLLRLKWRRQMRGRI